MRIVALVRCCPKDYRSVEKEKVYEKMMNQYQAEIEQKVQQSKEKMEEERQAQIEMLAQFEEELLKDL